MPDMKKILIVFGTRPEAIKLVPVIKSLKEENRFEVIVCSTGQHKEMVDQVLDIFDIQPDFDLHLMKANQELFDLNIVSLEKMGEIIESVKPDLLIVQGDTTTAFTASLAAYYNKIKIAHIEAGLRSHNNYHPFPEEANRKFISVLADFHFAPTKVAYQNLIKEGINNEKVFVTGNTVLDSLTKAKEKIESGDNASKIKTTLLKYLNPDFFEKRFILLTLHRREKFGSEFERILNSLKKLSDEFNYDFIYPVHLNPNVQTPVRKVLNQSDKFKLLPPLDYFSFLFLMNQCHFIVTDSGGIQEESYIFNKPVIVMREVTERTEAIDAGFAFLTGSSEAKLFSTFEMIDDGLNSGYNYFPAENPFGSGSPSEKITKILRSYFNTAE